MELDYKLNIIGEKVEYLPRKEFITPILNSSNKIFEITAGNGFGKTFLLNLIAYAFHADKLGNEEILQTLKERVADYDNKEAYKLEYSLSFNLPSGKKLLLSKGSNSERIIQYEDGPPINPVNLQKEISILYDVPVDPSLRLNEVIKDLGLWNNSLKEKFLKYNRILDNIERTFSSVRDEDKIKEYEKKVAQFQKELRDKESSLEEIEELIRNLSSYLDIERLINEYKGLKEIEEKLFVKEKELKKSPKPKKIDKKDEGLIKSMQRDLTLKKNEFKELMLKLITEITNNQELIDYVRNDGSLNKSFEFIRENDIDVILEDDNYSNPNSFNDKLQFLTDGLLLYINKEESGKKYVVHNFLKQLLEQIDELIENDAQSILEVLTKNETNILKQEIESRILENKIVNYSNLKEILKTSPRISKNYISEAIKISGKIEVESKKKGVDSDGERYYKLKGIVETLKLQRDKKSKVIDQFKYNLSIVLGIDSSYLDSFDRAVSIKTNIKTKLPSNIIQSNLNEELNSNNKRVQQLKTQIEEAKKSKDIFEAMLNAEQNKGVSKYSLPEQQKIKNFKRGIQIVIKNTGEFNDLISNINNGDLGRFKDEEDLKFINVAGRIIAYSMDNKILRSDGEYITLNYFDIINKEFHCEDDVVIRKDDISTGLASANYLRQRIENVSGDYVVILLDEIGNMAKDTLTEVINSIKKIEHQNRLVLALLTQPSAKKEEIIINEY